jgi:OOP family OmpA-OmpF porin
MKRARKLSTVAVLGLMASGAAFAQPLPAPWRGDFWGYLGASAGESKFRTDCSRTITQYECDTKDTGFKVYAGGRLTQFLALEAGYTDFGRIKAGGHDVDAYAVPLSLVAHAPIGRFGVFGKVGGLYGRTDVKASFDTLTASGHKTGWGWTYGAGGTFALTPVLQLRAEWERYKLDFVSGESDVDMLSAGLQLRF